MDQGLLLRARNTARETLERYGLYDRRYRALERFGRQDEPRWNAPVLSARGSTTASNISTHQDSARRIPHQELPAAITVGHSGGCPPLPELGVLRRKAFEGQQKPSSRSRKRKRSRGDSLPSEGEIKAAAASDEVEALAAHVIASRLLPAPSAAFTEALQGIIHRARLVAALQPTSGPLGPPPTLASAALPFSSNPTATAALSSSSQRLLPDVASFNTLPSLALGTSHVDLSTQGLPFRSSSYMKHLPGNLPVQSSSDTDFLSRNFSLQSSGYVDLSTRNLPPQFSGHTDPFTRNPPVVSNHTRNHTLQSTREADAVTGNTHAQSSHRDMFLGNVQSLIYADLLTGSLPVQQSSHPLSSDISASIPPIHVTASACVDPARTCLFPEDELRKLLSAVPRVPPTYEGKECERTFTLPQCSGEHMSSRKKEERLKVMHRRKAEAVAQDAVESLCELQKASLPSQSSGIAESAAETLTLTEAKSAVPAAKAAEIPAKEVEPKQPFCDAGIQSQQQLLLDQQPLHHRLTMLPNRVLVPPAASLVDPHLQQDDNELLYMQHGNRVCSGPALVFAPPAPHCVPEGGSMSAKQHQKECDSHGTTILDGSRACAIDLNSDPVDVEGPLQGALCLNLSL